MLASEGGCCACVGGAGGGGSALVSPGKLEPTGAASPVGADPSPIGSWPGAAASVGAAASAGAAA
eukprot:CAMPEP_0118824526 /NCGR_PEP_ID=MMETSP1162-20130426/10670_1 /TAXON_ID=33656 /ORGANISM="Phaeocystis Sp, Strain CCMP2710" /LENGTH=64 /DNA_ID=CAMNT_0006755167 /DNA_START=198 /DNA_END=388 /DNA_ORIENTATION=-